MKKLKPIQSYVSLDLETTGLNPKEDSIIEIGAIKVINGEVTDKYKTFVIPAKKLSERVEELTGIKEADLETGIPLQQAVAEILEFVGELPLLGHSILFDYSFLKRAAVNQKLTFEKEGIDTLQLARVFLPELKSKRLEDLCAYYKIQYRAHRACEDADAARRLYNRLVEQFYKEEETAQATDSTAKLFEPVRLIYKVKRESPATKHQKERLRELIQKHGLHVDYDVEKLTRNQASRYTDKIMEQYGRG